MNANLFTKKDYENETTLKPKKTNPIQTQSKPVLSAAEWANLKRNEFNFSATVYYESKPTFTVRKGRPNNQNLEFTTAFSCGARIVTPGG